MRSPLALVEVSRHDPRTGRNTREWAVVRTAQAARGLVAYRVVFVRKPDPQERACVEAALCRDAGPDPKVMTLDGLFEISLMYQGLCK